MTLRGPDPESYITEYTSVYEYSTRIRGHRWGAVGEGGRATGRPTLEHTHFTLIYTVSHLNTPVSHVNTPISRSFFSSLLLPSLKLSGTHVYYPSIRALLGIASRFCEVVALKLRIISHSNQETFSRPRWRRGGRRRRGGTPYTLHLTPYTQHPKPHTLHPTSSTLNPTP